jgi:hypothetical protein
MNRKESAPDKGIFFPQTPYQHKCATAALISPKGITASLIVKLFPVLLVMFYCPQSSPTY